MIDLALMAVPIDTNPGEKYHYENRTWQGIPTIERTKSGRLWVAYYSGGEGEGPDNYVLVCISNDDGKSWSLPVTVVDPPDKVRAFDPCLWIDPMERLWLFWAQSYDLFDGQAGVWCSICENPDSDISWTEPKRIANGVMMNKPTVLSNGTWCLPCAIWNIPGKEGGGDGIARGPIVPIGELKCEGFSNVIMSDDQGESFYLAGSADVPERSFDEHMIIERKDESLWMLVRTFYGIGESISYDGGNTWSKGKPTDLGGPNSRFFIRRLKSGRLLLVNHYQFTRRNNLTAFLSDDDGKTWRGNLILDERDQVSYPDGVETEDGRIYVIYDRERYGAKEILYAVFTEEDVLKGKFVASNSKLKQVIK